MIKRLAKALVVLFLGAFLVIEANCYQNLVTNENVIYTSPNDLWREGELEYKGELYHYNDTIKTYLIMGIDKLEPVQRDETEAGQSDALFLLLLDQKNEKIKIIAINRNTITDIKICDQDGFERGTKQTFLCLQHAYGDGAELSCENTVWAVSKLFYQLPIDGYISMNMGAVGTVNDLIGGVEVEVMEDVFETGMTEPLYEGQVVRLWGSQAFSYVHYRDMYHPDGATRRVERQKQYLKNAYRQVMNSDENKINMLIKGYQAVKPYVVTNVDVLDMAYEMWKTGIQLDNIISIPGEDIPKENYIHHIVDQEALLDILIETYYEKDTE